MSVAPLFVFRAFDASDGPELWITDGQASGTFLLKDIYPGTTGSYPSYLRSLGNGLMVFAANDGISGRELWVTDGTAGGTSLVADIAPGIGSSITTYGTDVIRVIDGNRAVFIAADSGNNRELWVTDGSAGGTYRLADIRPGSSDSDLAGNFGQLGDGRLLFNANNGTSGSELWVTDGTSAGTLFVKDINTAYDRAPSDPFFGATLGNGSVVFAAQNNTNGREIWVSDGSAAGTTLLRDINLGNASSEPNSFVALGDGRVLFRAFTGGSGGIGRELWITDGTPDGTLLVKDINPGYGNAFRNGGDSNRADRTAIGGDRVVFQATDANGSEVWVTDGSSTGTYRLADINPGAGDSSPLLFTPLGNGVTVFRANSASGTELWQTDGTIAGTSVLARFVGFGTVDDMFATGDGRALFSAFTLAEGNELWITDGTAAGTRLVADLVPGTSDSLPSLFTRLDVLPANAPPVADAGAADQQATANTAFAYTLPADAFADPDAGDVLTLSARLASGAALPGWLSFDPVTGSFAGTPANGDAGALDIRVTATDLAGASVDDDFRLNVTAAVFSQVAISAATDAGEGGALRFTLTRTGSAADLATPVTVTAVLEGGSAAEEDLVDGFRSLTVSFAAGETTQTVSVATVDDDATEAAETVRLRLSGATGGTLSTVDPTSAEATIWDDDGRFVTISEVISATEGLDAAIAYVLRRSGELSDPMTVAFVLGSTSTLQTVPVQASDLVAGAAGLGRGTLTFAPNEAEKRIERQIVDDLRPEGTEALEILLDQVEGGTLGVTQTVLGTYYTSFGIAYIFDNDMSDISLAAPALVTEGEGDRLSFTLERTIWPGLSAESLSGPVTVSYALSRAAAGAADAADIVGGFTTGTVTFAPYQLEAQIDFDIVDDSLAEPIEAVRLTLTDITGARVRQGSALGYILDDDTAVPPSSGPDAFGGTASSDRLSGLGGADTILGGGGSDTLYGNTGDDLLLGGTGLDLLLGGVGRDVMRGEDGIDTLRGGLDEDSLYGGAGDDLLLGGPGDDSLEGGAGNDILWGGLDEDNLSGGDGDDRLIGGPGDDSLDGGAGNDLLWSGEGADTMRGGDGNDRLYGRLGADSLDGGLGADTLAGDDGGDTLDGGAENDVLTGNLGADLLRGGDGADVVYGGEDADTLEGGAGADTLMGGPGPDLLRGGADGGTLTIAAGQGVGLTASVSGGDFLALRVGPSGDGSADVIIYDLTAGDGVDRVRGFEVGIDTLMITTGGAAVTLRAIGPDSYFTFEDHDGDAGIVVYGVTALTAGTDYILS